MTQIQISTTKIEKLRDKMKDDPMYEHLRLRYDSEVVNRICDSYLQQERDKALVKSVVDELLDRGILRISKRST